jgi:hypothetical protein
MRLLTTVLAAALLAVAGVGTAHGAEQAPHLVLTSMDPVTVHGIAFPRHTRVRVRLRGGGTDVTHRVRTGRRGRFTTAFGGAAAGDRCTLMLVTATSASGLKVQIRRPPQPGCPPA